MEVWFSIEEEPPPRGAKASWRDLKTFVSAPPERVRRVFALLTRTYHGSRQPGSYHRTQRYARGFRYTLQREPSSDPSRDLIVHSDRLGELVLSKGNAIRRLSDVLRGALSYGRGGLNLLCMSFASHG